MNAVVKPDASLPEVRDKITALKEWMVALPDELKLPFDNRHDFCPGIYARTIFMKADTVVISKIHKTQHFFVVVQGSCTVIDSHGTKQLIKAPYLGVTMPGTERALHIHEDCIWTCFHVTDLTDPEEIGRQILAESLEVEK